MEQTRREVLGIPAVALVEPYDVHPARETFRCDAAHVMRIARSVQAMEDDDCRPVPRLGVPVAVSEYSRVAAHVEIADDGCRQPRKVPRVPPSEQRHRVTAAQPWPRHERSWYSIKIRGAHRPSRSGRARALAFRGP